MTFFMMVYFDLPCFMGRYLGFFFSMTLPSLPEAKALVGRVIFSSWQAPAMALEKMSIKIIPPGARSDRGV